MDYASIIYEALTCKSIVKKIRLDEDFKVKMENLTSHFSGVNESSLWERP